MPDADAGEKVVPHAPRGALLAIQRAAIQAHLTPEELARRLLIYGLHANGYELGEVPVSATIQSFTRRE